MESSSVPEIVPAAAAPAQQSQWGRIKQYVLDHKVPIAGLFIAVPVLMAAGYDMNSWRNANNKDRR